MITTFKVFEKMGINQLALDIADKIWKELENAIKENKKQIIVNISEFNLNLFNFNSVLVKVDNIVISLKYDTGSSNAIILARKDPNNNEYYSLISLGILNNYGKYEMLLHEIKHLVYQNYKNKIINKNPKYKYATDDRSDKKRFFDDFFTINTFINNYQNFKSKFNSNQIITPTDYILHGEGSELYKKFLLFCYLANDDELTARLHEFYIKVKKSKNLLHTIKEYENLYPLKYYKEMTNFNFDINKLLKNELCHLTKDKKKIKKIESYIRKQGQKFINKLHKFSYFED
jgi:hypothetical protein